MVVTDDEATKIPMTSYRRRDRNPTSANTARMNPRYRKYELDEYTEDGTNGVHNNGSGCGVALC